MNFPPVIVASRGVHETMAMWRLMKSAFRCTKFFHIKQKCNRKMIATEIPHEQDFQMANAQNVYEAERHADELEDEQDNMPLAHMMNYDKTFMDITPAHFSYIHQKLMLLAEEQNVEDDDEDELIIVPTMSREKVQQKVGEMLMKDQVVHEAGPVEEVPVEQAIGDEVPVEQAIGDEEHVVDTKEPMHEAEKEILVPPSATVVLSIIRPKPTPLAELSSLLDGFRSIDDFAKSFLDETQNVFTHTLTHVEEVPEVPEHDDDESMNSAISETATIVPTNPSETYLNDSQFGEPSMMSRKANDRFKDLPMIPDEDEEQINSHFLTVNNQEVLLSSKTNTTVRSFFTDDDYRINVVPISQVSNANNPCIDSVPRNPQIEFEAGSDKPQMFKKLSANKFMKNMMKWTGVKRVY